MHLSPPQSSDPAYSASILAVAKELYDFADNFRELYHVSIPDADGYYQWASLFTLQFDDDKEFFLYGHYGDIQ